MSGNETKEMTSNARGRHSELLAQTAFLANGFEVSEPVTPLPYDLIVRNPVTNEILTVQVKTAFLRDEERYGSVYLVVRGARNSGQVYEAEDVDMCAAVWDGEVYIFPNREVSEYWERLDKVETGIGDWTKLRRALT